MSRHNRRRHRGGHNSSMIPGQRPEIEVLNTVSNISLTCAEAPINLRSLSKRDGLSARHWHNRYIAWQAREKRQQEERRKLEAERMRIFGGNENERDDDGLCTKMMDYFTGLDYIDP